ncbi:hypothetical protein EYC80_009295 [Monilinia laxa]|uniref:Uncharacterized protein n=1 Tax=Monilinia laxa TaxID=61186 RepID=A0A5N6JXD1_MONLA|nr:hypothetical protein EYC80_009295 [Monilinia laxa]
MHSNPEFVITAAAVLFGFPIAIAAPPKKSGSCIKPGAPLTYLYFTDPVNVMAPYWLNDSCSPFTSVNLSCNLKNIASYGIEISSAHHVITGLKFVKENGIQITIKKTGHDYVGRSNGERSLELWTHNLKDISFFNYTTANYTGPGAKVGAGAQFFEAYKVAAENGLRLAGGFCPTVDMAGGGGGGTYAVVLSLTTKAHADGVVAGGSFTINNTGDDRDWSAIEAWKNHPLLLDRIPGFTTDAFNLAVATWPKVNASILDEALAP